jgi:hypothetical protein
MVRQMGVVPPFDPVGAQGSAVTRLSVSSPVLVEGGINPTRAGSADLHGFLYPSRSVLVIESYRDADTRNRMADCAMIHNFEISSRIHKILVENGDVRGEWVGVEEACALRTHSVQAARTEWKR